MKRAEHPNDEQLCFLRAVAARCAAEAAEELGGTKKKKIIVEPFDTVC